MDSHLRILETKFKDERLNLQQNHNLEIQRVLKIRFWWSL